MKRIFLSVWFVLVVLQVTAQDRVTEIRSKLFDLNSKQVLVAAHRGDWRYAPENSMAAVENAIKMGVDIVEIDIQKTKDGKLILMHDRTLDRTSTGVGNVADWTLDSIKTLKLRNGAAIKTKHPVPTLEEVLIAAKGRVLINLDKAYPYFEDVYDLLEKTGTTRQIIMKGNKPVSIVKQEFGKYLDKVIYMPIVNLDKKAAMENVNAFVSEIKPVAFEFLYVSDENPLPKQVATILKGKSLIWYNTLWDTMAGSHDDDQSLEDPEKGYGYLVNTLNCRIIQTDRPEYLIRYLKSKGLH